MQMMSTQWWTCRWSRQRTKQCQNLQLKIQILKNIFDKHFSCPSVFQVSKDAEEGKKLQEMREALCFEGKEENGKCSCYVNTNHPLNFQSLLTERLQNDREEIWSVSAWFNCGIIWDADMSTLTCKTTRLSPLRSSADSWLPSFSSQSSQELKPLHSSQVCLTLSLISRHKMCPLPSQLAQRWSWQLLLHLKAEEDMEAKPGVLFLEKLHSCRAKRQSKDGTVLTSCVPLCHGF